TETNGVFDTRFGLPATGTDGKPGVNYFVEARDPATGLRGQAVATVFPTGTNEVKNFVNIRLLGKGALRINVIDGLGQPAAGAKVESTQGSFPQDRVEGVADTNGVIEFQTLFEGSYAVCASQVTGPTTVFGRVAATVSRDQLALATLRIAATAT